MNRLLAALILSVSAASACSNEARCTKCGGSQDGGGDDDQSSGTLTMAFTEPVGIGYDPGECGAVGIDVVANDGARLPANGTLISVTTTVSAFADAGCTVATTSVALTAGHADVYLRSVVPGEYAVSAAADGIAAGANTTLFIRAIRPEALRVHAQATAQIGECVRFEVTFENRFGLVAEATEATTVSMDTTPSVFTSTSSTCTDSVMSLPAPVGASRLFAYAVMDKLGTFTIAARGGSFPVTPETLEVIRTPFVATTDISQQPRFNQVVVAPDGKLWVVMESGAVMRSADDGTTFQELCRADGPNAGFYANRGLQVSPGSDGTGYQFATRIEATAGALCPKLGSPANLSTTPVAFAANGDVYAVQGFGSTLDVLRSQNQGRGWTTVKTVTLGYVSAIAVDPNDATNIVLSGQGGVYRSVAGADFTNEDAVQPSFLTYDPAHAGYIYAPGIFSSDGGDSWTIAAAYAMSLQQRWPLDATGAGYRLMGNSSSVHVEKAPDMRTPVWNALAAPSFPFAFDGITAQGMSLSVSADGQKIAVTIRGRLYVSTNGGASYDSIAVPANEPWTIGLAVDSPDGVSLTAMTTDWLPLTRGGTGPWVTHAGANQEPSSLRLRSVTPSAFYAHAYTSGSPVVIVGSADGFTTLNDSVTANGSGLQTFTAVRDAEPTRVVLVAKTFSATTLAVSTNTADSFSTTTLTSLSAVNAVDPYAWVSPTDADIVWFVGTKTTFTEGHLWALDIGDGVLTDLTAATAIVPGALEVYSTGTGHTARVISTTGELVTSTDNLQTFSSPTPAVVANCAHGVLRSSPLERTTVAAICTNTILLTRDDGANWRGFTPPRCIPLQVAFTADAMIVSCLATEPYVVPLVD